MKLPKWVLNSLISVGLSNEPERVTSSPSNSLSTSPLIRPLTWGHVNFIHTTDTHGWLPGHLSEPQFSADWGNYLSFIDHMRSLADEKGVDLIVVDTGDRHDGNGLSDATYPDGELSQKIFMKADIDVVAIGNHELYRSEVTSQEYALMRPYYGERYISSNIDILDEQTGEWVPMGPRYRIFTTKNQNIKVLALGFLFNFQGNDYNSRVNKVQEVIKEDWFQKAIRTSGLDLVVLTGHAPVRYFDEFDAVIKEIRSVWPGIAIQALGGHTHIRDYRIYDDLAVGLESGRFLETIGFASVNFTGKQTDEYPFFATSFDRSYIDFNVKSLSTHVYKSPEEFITPEGEETSLTIKQYREDLNLTEFLTCVPQTYFTTRAKYPGPNSLFSLLEEDVLPLLSGVAQPSRDHLPRFVLINTGAIRFDLFKGPFTKDTGYIVSPFKNEWTYIPSVPIELARKFLPLLNSEGSILEQLRTTEESLDYTQLGLPEQRGRGRRHRPPPPPPPTHVNSPAQQILSYTLPEGYVTHDDLGSDGDDTPHKAWTFYDIPNAIQSTTNINASTTHVDVIFYDFMKPFMVDVLTKLNQQQLSKTISYYGGESIITLLPQFFEELNTGKPCNFPS